MSRSLALILGVGAVDGIGGALCLRAAAAGHHVIAAGRTAEKLNHLVAAVEAAGGSAEGHVVDLADSDRIGDLFAAVDGRAGSSCSPSASGIADRSAAVLACATELAEPGSSVQLCLESRSNTSEACTSAASAVGWELCGSVANRRTNSFS